MLSFTKLYSQLWSSSHTYPPFPRQIVPLGLFWPRLAPNRRVTHKCVFISAVYTVGMWEGASFVTCTPVPYINKNSIYNADTIYLYKYGHQKRLFALPSSA